MVSALLAAEDEGERLTHEELLSAMLLILVAGNETTRTLIGSGMLALLQNPGQLRRLRARPDLLDAAIDELLRYDSPVQLDGRCAREDVELGGKLIRAGNVVISLIGAANRDPERFDHPDVLDIERQDTGHLSFGRGIHYCLGSALAVLEARIAFSALLARFPRSDWPASLGTARVSCCAVSNTCGSTSDGPPRSYRDSCDRPLEAGATRRGGLQLLFERYGG